MSATSDEDLMYSPSKLGEYTVIQEIGEGTFGKVKSKRSADPATLSLLTFRLSRGRPHHHRP
jgi:hypothetical protein